MTLQSRLADLVAAIGADIKDLKAKVDVPIVGVLPLNPPDGTVVDFQTAAMATDGVMWRLRYQNFADKPHKWIFLGGGSLVATWTTFTGDPPYKPVAGGGSPGGGYGYIPNIAGRTPGTGVDIPLNGEYELDYGVSLQAENGNAQDIYTAVFDQTHTQLTAGDAAWARTSLIFEKRTPQATMRRTLAANSHVDVRTAVQQVSTYTAAHIRVRPLRVG